MPHRLTMTDAALLATAAGGVIAMAIGMLDQSDDIQRLGLTAILIGSIPFIIKTSVASHMRRAEAAIDAYRDAQVEAGKAEVETYRAQIEGETFAKVIHLLRTGQLTPADGATIHTLRPTTDNGQAKAKCSG